MTEIKIGVENSSSTARILSATPPVSFHPGQASDRDLNGRRVISSDHGFISAEPDGAGDENGSRNRNPNAEETILVNSSPLLRIDASWRGESAVRGICHGAAF